MMLKAIMLQIYDAYNNGAQSYDAPSYCMMFKTTMLKTMMPQSNDAQSSNA
jgi:hypothetical protein